MSPRELELVERVTNLELALRLVLGWELTSDVYTRLGFDPKVPEKDFKYARCLLNRIND